MRTPYTPDTQRAWVDVDLDALVRNAQSYRGRVGVPLLPMVKADGYGLGAVAVARSLAGVGVWGFGVATVAEARALHLSGVVAPLLVCTPLAPPQVELHQAVAARPTIGDLEALEAWLAAGDAPFHVEIDTGMRRSGFGWNDRDRLAALRDRLAGAKGWEGVFTHFHSAATDDRATAEQWRRFHEAVDALGRRPAILHTANSAAGGYGATYAGDLARPGIHLYGGHLEGLDAVPVVALRARVTAVRRIAAGDSVSYDATWTAPHATTIATLGIGYGDGVPRHLSNVGAVELLGQRLRIVGRVTMDQLMLDAGDLPVSVGDVATVFGGRVSLDEQAALAGTIPYELLTALGARLPRRYQRTS